MLGAPTADQLLRDALAPECDVRRVPDVEGALAALRERHFDAVISATNQFLPLMRSVARAEAETILEMIGHGVCTVDTEGNLLWGNRRFHSYPDLAIDAIREAATAMCRELAARPTTTDGQPLAHRSVSADGSFFFDVTASPLRGPTQEVERAVVLATDVTATRLLQQKINAIDDAGRELVRLDAQEVAKMDVAERLELLEQKMVRYSRELLQFEHFTIRVLDPPTGRLSVLLAEGMSDEAQSRQIYATSEGNGISGHVAATGRSYICPDVSRDPRVLPGIANVRSSLTVPLLLRDKVVGTFNVESEQVAAFSEDDRQFAEIFGRYIAMALNLLQLLAVERHTTTGQITADVAADIGTPLNDILTQASAIMEDYIGYDDLRQRLHGIIDAVDLVKKRVNSQRPSAGVTGLVDEDSHRDPVLTGKHILIADDEDVIRDTISDVLTRAGAITTLAANGDEAIALIRNHAFDLVISDINMPRHSGYDVFAAAKQTRPDARVLLITGFGYDPNHSIVKASREGLAGVLFKPFKVGTLIDETRKAIAKPATEPDSPE